MKTWTKILPFFFIEWFAKRYTEIFSMNENWVKDNPNVVVPFKGIYIIKDGNKNNDK